MRFSLNINIAKFIDVGYWLNPTPPSGQVLFLILAVFLTLLLLIGGLVVWFLNRKYFKEILPKKRVLGWVATTLFSFVPVALFLLALRLEGFGYISIRLLWPLLFLLILGLNGFYLYYYFTAVPKQITKIETIKLKQKYFRIKKKKAGR